MKVKQLSALAGAGVAILIAAPASADFTSLSLVQITDWSLAGPTATQAAFDAAGYQTWQIFANFDEGSDNLLVMGSVLNAFTLSASDGFIYNNESGGFSPIARNGWDGPAPGSGFSGGGETIPYDSHTGIGINLAPLRYGNADGAPATTTFGQGLNNADAGVVVTPDSGDGLASTVGNDGSIFMMQITWNATASMTVNFEFTYDTTPAGPAAGIDQITVPNTVVIPAIPAPGAFALLGLAGLVGRPRRRRA